MPFTIDPEPEERTAITITRILDLATAVETIIMNDTRTYLHITTAAAMATVETTAKNTRAPDPADRTHQEAATHHAAAEESIAANTRTATALTSVTIKKQITTEGQITEFLENLKQNKLKI